MERRGEPGGKSKIWQVEWIWPQIHATPVQIDHWLRLVLCTGCDERPWLILSCTSFENEITRTTNAGITLLLTTDRADMHIIYILDNSSADMPATITW